MRQDVNYIVHHKNVNMKIIECELNATHISLYNALFLIWNECGFETELSINRNDVMQLSKIGSANTYTKCLKDLDKLEFLKYKPSFNPLIGSKINLYRFDKSSDNSTDKGSVKGSSKGTDNGCDNSIATLYKHINKETIKQLNNETKEKFEKIIDFGIEYFKKSKEGKLPKVAEKGFNEEVYKTYETCLEFFPEHLHPDPKVEKGWLDTIDKLNRIDNIPYEAIVFLTKAAREDDFWQTNFLSMNKLRQKNKDGIMYIVVFSEKFKPKQRKSKQEQVYNVHEESLRRDLEKLETERSNY